MQDTSQVWMTILAYMAWAIGLAIVTHLWIRHHLKKKTKRESTKVKFGDQ